MNKGFYKAGLSLLKRRFFFSNHKFSGNATEICQQIVDKAWNGQFYQTSLGHFSYFWIRDFGIVVDSLLASGNSEKVKQTIDWVMAYYMKAKRVALCVNKRGNVFDAPKKSIDALPWLLFSIYKSGYKLNESQKKFLEKELKRFQREFIDPKSGEIINGASFSELRDAVNYTKSSYAVMMMYILADSSKKLGLKNFQFQPKIYKNQFEKYWNGKYFDSDINNRSFSAESNLLPFFLGIIDDDKKLKKIFNYINAQKINHPFPMKYTNFPKKFKYHLWGRFIMPNYAGSTIWTWMGAIYVRLLKKYKSADFKTQFASFKSLIEEHKNFPELLHPDGKWYKVPFYRADEGMIWAALMLDIFVD